MKAGGLVPISSFVRIKPLEIDRSGGTAAGKLIKSWNESGGTVEMTVGGGSSTKTKVYDHLSAVIPPDATQESVYATIAAPLVQKFVDGYDCDLLSYGQTGSGKTYTMFGPPFSMAKAAEEGASVQPEHGFLLRSGLDALEAVAAIEARGDRAILHGSMVELSIQSFQEQSVRDLLKGYSVCFVDDCNHLQGAQQMELRSIKDVVQLAAAVEQRLTRGTRMNDTSSRSHCIALLKLTVLTTATGMVRESRMQFFDLMGSERFVGQNAAHDTSKSSKSTEAGWEGIFSNLSLMALVSCIDGASALRRKKGGAGAPDKASVGMLLTKLMQGSLSGSALTTMITCVSQSPRNGDETYLTLKYGNDMAKLLNRPSTCCLFLPISSRCRE
jgi:kinesin family protein 4/21/27